ncbi:MAG TPA: tripartite tricarboxylate transporter substrate binding protein [Xanthobacteraceae bacterium]|nr:tripartite tricarboxylate transporter substrate binding protein [Xanthobacteraceae bacterium]
MKAMPACIAALLWLAATPALAQTPYPQTVIRILVGFPAGTAPDVTARVIADKMTADFGQPVIIENISGASGNIACDRVAKAAPDGYTLVMCGNGSLVVAPSLYEKLPYDPSRDFAPISRVFVAANLLVVHPDVPATSLPELVALAKAKPGELTYGHTGVGTSQHLAGELFKSMAQVNIQPIAYRGTTALLPDLLAGRITMAFANIVNVVPLVRQGKLRAFAVSSRKRSALVPDLPTMIEAGFPDYEAVPWFGLMAPARTPRPIIEKLHAEAVKALAVPEVRKALENQGLDLIGGTPEEFSETIRTETPYWAKVIKQAGIKATD